MTLHRVDKTPDLRKVYTRQKNNKTLKAFRGEEDFVPPEGTQWPQVVFVGDIGPYSRIVLEKAVCQAGLKTYRCLFTTLWKHKTHEKPTDKELDTVLMYVEDEMAILRPKIVVPVGQEAVSCFLPHDSVSAVHGEVYDWESHYLVPFSYEYLVFPDKMDRVHVNYGMSAIASMVEKRRGNRRT